MSAPASDAQLIKIAPMDDRTACCCNHALRVEIEGTVQPLEMTGDLPKVPATAEAARTMGYEEVHESPGTVIGPYKLLEQIGAGGMGVVYMAEQQAPILRRVALKIIKPGMDTHQVIARFEAERQALALMDHHNIARVLDAGTTGLGRPYFVMELVRGIPITEYCDQNSLSVLERLDLFVQICHAAQHAHQKGIIHRDIKPSNVLVTLHDGCPVPKVIDFGIAKATNQHLTEKTLFTSFAQMIGTPLYMSPEQAQMTSLDVDTRSDIYSLGVLLYELLTGTTPFDENRIRAATYDEIRRIIREEEPPRPSARISTLGETRTAIAAHRQVDVDRLRQLVRGDLDWIVMKALEKDRTRRYETANGLARDILRYLGDQPVDACPPSATYRFRKFARRNRIVLTTAGLVSVALVLGTLLSTWQAVRATRAERLVAECVAHNDTAAARASEAAQRKLALDQQKIAEENRAEAEQQRSQAEANLQKARAAIDEYFALVYGSKQLDAPGLQPLRQKLLEPAVRYYERFRAEPTNEPAASSPVLQQRRQSAEPETLAIEILGRTQCTPTRKADIAPVPLHPVNEVLVEPGSRVKKGQALVKLDDDEQQAEVRAKQAALENTKIVLTEARRHLAAIDQLFQKGASPEQRYHEVRVAARTAELNEQAAQAALDSSRAELEHYEVRAAIDGVVSWLVVHPGMVSRPGTTTWGEIVDLQEIDVCCELTLEQADRLAVGQPAEVRRTDQKAMLGTGQVVFMGITADEKSSLVPVVVRLPNPQERLRSGEPVNVRLIIAGSSSRPDPVRESACWGQ